MSTKIYLNFLTAIIILLVFAGVFAFFYKGINGISKTIIIWYLIVLILNLANIIGVMKFYLANQNRKGPKGRKGDKGLRGFKGSNNLCGSCGSAGAEKNIFGSFVNDKGERVLSSKVKEGQCVFPFSHNYQYQHECVKNSPPPGQTVNDANMFGWCATKINEDREVVTYAYCNANKSIQEKLLKEKDLQRRRKEFMENNFGILDIRIVAENTTNEARRKCEAMNGYDFYERDLNEGTDGKFIHLCIKKGYGGSGIGGLYVSNIRPETSPLRNIYLDTSNPNNIFTQPASGLKHFRLINVNLNQDSGPNSESNRRNTQLYLYKHITNKNFIKDIQVVKSSEGTCNAESGYEEIHPDLNQGTHLGTTNRLQLCVSTQAPNVSSIDTAFVFTDNKLYIFRGQTFYKMTDKPVNKSLISEPKYPKNLSLKWAKTKSKDPMRECRLLNDKPAECKAAPNCNYDDSSDPPRCEQISNYDAAFTYGFNRKTYFFKGSKVFIYDEKKMKMTDDSPFNITEVFKGIPNNINAAFTWAKDNSTYFFKGPFYYKYNDKTQEVERGYPKRSNVRWENMPPLIDAIFSLPFNLEGEAGNQSTYVISGDQTWYINPSNDKLIRQKNIDERFSSLNILLESPTDPVSSPTTASG